jgi:endonuclease I
MMKKILLATIFGLFLSFSFAQIPAGYYDSATGTGCALKTQLYNIIKDHNPSSYDQLWTDMQSTDKKANGYVWDMYSDNPGGTPAYDFTFITEQCGNYSGEGDCYNREHSFPKSWFNDATPMYSDLFHLVPTDGYVNGRRGNYLFGEVGTTSWTSTNGSKLGTCNYSGYTGTVFEPIDEYKGDFARNYFYMATRYEDIIAGWETNDSNGDAVLDGTSDHVYEDWYLNMIVEWHNNDPVSQKEIDRNDAVYAIQNNRNPFIDHPEYVAQIWGGDGVFISNVSQSPESPTSADAVSITATITSSGGTITTANLKWGTATGTYSNTVAMTASKGNYSADIPVQANGTNVYYIIEAEDDNAQSSTTAEYNYTINDNPDVVLLDEDFTSCPATSWTTYSVLGTENWECGSQFMQINAYGSDVACNDWLISPEVNLNTYEAEKLSFKSWNKYTDSYYPPIEVKYSTDYSGTGDPSSANWSNLTATWSAENSETWTESGEIDLLSIVGSQVYIAFQYTSSGTGSGSSAYWEIDDILITGEEKTSGVPQITGITNTPLAPTDEESVTVSATITDDGTISTAEIKWGTESGSYPNSVSMTYSGDVYSGDIPAQTSGTTVYYVIEATDNDSETNRSDENSYTVALNELPQITNVSHLPLAPTEGEDVVISASVTDADGTISLVEIKWGTAKGAFDNTVTMTYTGSDNIYNGTITSQTGGTIVSYVIEASDNDSDSNRTDEFSFSFNTAGNELPEITNITINPTSPESEDVVTVSATITDSDGTISSAKVKWGIESGSYPNIVLMTSSGDSYTAEIPAQLNDTHVYFIVYALDEDGGSEQSDEMDYLVEDVNLLPEITNVVFDPENPESSDNVRISATITDSDGTISSTTLKWGTSAGVYPNEINMTVSSSDTYISYSNIPAQQDGTVVYFVIKAEDNEAGIKTSTEFNYTVVDPVNQAPVISDVLINPESPTENDNVTISATATDPDGSIESVVLKWKIGEGSFTNMSMNLSGGKYYGQIPKQAIGLTVYFTVLATDNEGLEGSIDDNYTVSQSSGIGDFNYEMDLLLYPNPVKEYLTIQLENYTGIVELNIYDVIGIPVVSQKLDFSNEYKIAINNLESGLYLVSFVIDNVLITKRIVVEK